MAEQKKQVAAWDGKHATGQAPKLLWLYSAYDGLPYVAGGDGMPSALSKRLGAVNVFDGIDDHWPEVQWEQVAQQDPDLIIVADLSDRGRPGDTPAEKINTLKENPATATIRAVREDRFVIVPGPAVDSSVRFTEALNAEGTDLQQRGLIQ